MTKSVQAQVRSKRSAVKSALEDRLFDEMHKSQRIGLGRVLD
jgi:hypothetical protein